MEAARHEPAAPGAARSSRERDSCPICLGPIEGRAGVEPCWHEFCHTCIQHWAATANHATCPLCRGRILAIHRLPLDHNHTGLAQHLRRRVHPYERPRQQGQQRQQGRQQQQRGFGGPQYRSFSARYEKDSPHRARQRVRSLSGQWNSDGRRQLHYRPDIREDPSWLQRVREEVPGSGDRAHHLLQFRA